MLNIVELLALRGLDTKKRIKLVRHQDKKRYDIRDIYQSGFLDVYQSYQSRKVFECDFVIAFLGMEASRAVFVGAYSVKGRKAGSKVPLPKGFPYPEMRAEADFHYELERLPQFDDLKDRVVIEWGKSPLAWHQWLQEREVVEVLPIGYVRQFRGYLDFILSYDELKAIVSDPIASKEWHRMLSAVAGVYLIADAKTGLQYVGSAYGEGGILGRWKSYASCPDGGNDQLKALLANKHNYESNFRYTILQTLPRWLTRNEVIECERLFKEKLGTRAFGLNSN